ncbi:MAG: exodeoxyribonuclease VII small subunit [Clostridia bacterium]|nr:exodeoxyribonuclease VII small subunit [Clostridia bacterium]
MKEENTFEQNIANLEGIVTELEKGNLNLDDSMKKFEEGMKLSSECSKMLEEAEKKITILLEQSGTVVEENFE